MSRAGLAHLGEMVFIPRSYEIFYLTSTKEFVMSLEKGFSITSQKIFVGLQDMSWRRLQHVFSVTILRLPRRFEDVLKTSWKTKNCYAEDVLKTSWRHYGDKQNTYWGYLYLTNLNVYLTNLYFTNLYLTNLRRIQNALIRTQ